MERDDTRDYRVEGEQVNVWMETHYLYFTDCGGWRWMADTQDRLSRRLLDLSPFVGLDSGWGDPGHRLDDGELDERISEHTREMMVKYMDVCDEFERAKRSVVRI